MVSYPLTAPGDRHSMHATARVLRQRSKAVMAAYNGQMDDQLISSDDFSGEVARVFHKGAVHATTPFWNVQNGLSQAADAFDQLGWDMHYLQQLYDGVKDIVRGTTMVQGDSLVPPLGIARIVPDPAPGQLPLPQIPPPGPNTLQSVLPPDIVDTWNRAAAAYKRADDYRVKAQTAFVNALALSGIGNVPYISNPTTPWNTDTPYVKGKRPEPPQHRHDPSPHRRSPDTPGTPDAPGTQVPSGGHGSVLSRHSAPSGHPEPAGHPQTAPSGHHGDDGHPRHDGHHDHGMAVEHLSDHGSGEHHHHQVLQERVESLLQSNQHLEERVKQLQSLPLDPSDAQAIAERQQQVDSLQQQITSNQLAVSDLQEQLAAGGDGQQAQHGEHGFAISAEHVQHGGAGIGEFVEVSEPVAWSTGEPMTR